MSDLIRREDVIKLVNQFVFGLCKEQNDEVRRTFNKYIEKMPTAYSVDRVVEELEKEAERWEDSGKEYKDKCEIAVGRGLRNSIKIVKNGGLDDVCEWKSDCHLENDNPDEWLISPHNPKRIFSTDIIYCPYCGKKIKAGGENEN